MKKRILSAVLALCLVLPLLPVNARAATSGSCVDGLTYVFDVVSETLKISGKGAMTDFSSSTAAPWRSERNDIKRVEISSGVTSIGSYAFTDCVNLTSITLPNSITAIGGSAFMGCTSLISIRLPDSITWMGTGIFNRCSNLTSVKLPSGIKILPGNTFFYCTRLASVTVPDGVTVIGTSAFSQCSALTSVKLPNSLETLRQFAFSGCTSLASIDLPPCINDMEASAFFGCSSLTSIIIPAHVGSIMESTFEGCSSLESVELPHYVTTTRPRAFEGCSALKTVRYRGTEEDLNPGGLAEHLKNFFDPAVAFECLPEDHCHTITFHGYFSSGVENLPQPITVLYGRSVSKPSSDPTLTGYRFTGWYINTETMISSNRYNFSNLLRKDITLYAGWDQNQYIVSFDANNNDYWYNLIESKPNPYSPNKVPHGAALQPPDISPQNAGYTLTGWYKEEECQNKWDFDKDRVTGRLTIYAGWKSNTPPPTYTVTFDSNGGSIVASQSIQENGKVTEPSDPLRAGYRFGGWYQEEECINVWNFGNDTVTQSLTLHAKWTPISYSVRYGWNDAGGTFQECFPVQMVSYGSTLTAPTPDPQRTGYRFGGWYQDSDCTNIWTFDTDTVKNDTRIYAKWTPISYTVTFDLNGDGATGSFLPIPVSYGEKIPAPIAPPDWTDHTFGGWYREKECTNAWDFDKDTVTGDTTLYAKWTADPVNPQSHTVTFDSQGGTTISSQTVTSGGKATLPDPAPTRTDYTFQGWYKEQACTTPWNFNTHTVSKDITLYAKWTKDTPPAPTEYTVTFDSQGGTAISSQTVISGGKATLPDPAPTRTDYTFQGWYKEQACTTPWNFNTHTVSKDITLYAKWTKDTPPAPTEYTVTFDSQGGTTISSQTVTSGGKATLPDPAPTRTDYTFQGWYKEQACTTPWNFDTDTVSNNTTLYAKWEPIPKSYTITLNPNGGALPDGQSATLTTGSDGKLASLPQDPTRENYTFKGWTTLNGTAVTTDTEFTSNTTIYAQWENENGAETYTVSFHLNYENAPAAPAALTTGADHKLTSSLPTPERTGYTFDGWFTDATNGIKIQDGDPFFASTTLYAHWTKNSGTTDPDDPKTFTITFHANGGEGDPVAAATGTDGKVAVWPKNPTRTGYIFDGWYTDVSGGTAVTKETVFEQDVTVYAHWTAEEPSTPDITRYPIYWPGSVYGGRVYVSHSYAAQGTRVTIEVSPRNNYELDRLSVINLDTGRAVRLTEYDWDEYTFVMPASAVEIEVSYDFIDSLDHYSAGAYFILPEPQIPTGPNAWYYRDRHIYHINNGLVPDGTPVTRDMFLSILYNLSGSHTNNSTAVGSETNNAQTWATSHNIVPDIYASGLWGPDKALSREQAAMLIFGYAGYRNYSVSQGSNLSRYADYNQIRPIARTAMSWVLATNLMPATTASTLSPQAVLTCGQAGNLIFQFQTNVARNYSFY